MSEETEQSSSLQNPLYCMAWEAIKNIDFCYLLEEAKFYIFSDGYWHFIHEEELLFKLGKKLPHFNSMAISLRKQVLDNVKIIKHFHLDIFNKNDYLNLQNYMVNPYTKDVFNHDKEFYSTLQIPYKYDALASCELWLKTLDEILEGNRDKINILQEFVGYAITRDVKQEKALLLIGDSRSGKSTIINTIRHLVGINNCSSVSIKDLYNPQCTAMMINKLINIDTDVSAKALEYEDQFKKITTGEEIGCNQKFIPAFTFNPYCKIIMAANDFPRITDHSSAFYKRLILIPCDRVFEEQEQNKNLRNELLNDLPGILNWAIQGLHRLHKRGRFEDCDFMRDAIEELREDSNPIDLFFKEHIEVGFGSEIEKGFLYDKYKQWSEESKQYILSKAKFSTCVYRKFSKHTPKNTTNPNTSKRIWRNIKYVQFKNEVIETWQYIQPAAVSNTTDAKAVNPPETTDGQPDIKWED